jgi:hypothetical protein
VDKVRVLRILEYVGTREWVEKTLENNSVPLNGTKIVGTEGVIKSAIVSDFPEKIEEQISQGATITTCHHLPPCKHNLNYKCTKAGVALFSRDTMGYHMTCSEFEPMREN